MPALIISTYSFFMWQQRSKNAFGLRFAVVEVKVEITCVTYNLSLDPNRKDVSSTVQSYFILEPTYIEMFSVYLLNVPDTHRFATAHAVKAHFLISHL